MSQKRVAYLRNLPQKYKADLDLTFRMSFLEGVTRKTPGEWSRRPLQGAAEAREWFVTQEIPMDPGWFQHGGVSWTLELDRRVRGYAFKFKDALAAVQIEPEDIINELVTATTSSGGERKQRVFYSFGLSWTNPSVLSDTDPGASTIEKGLTRAVWQFIRDQTRSFKNRPTSQGPRPDQFGGGLRNEHNDKMERAMDKAPDDSRGPEFLLLDLMSGELSARNPIAQLADAAIDKLIPVRKGKGPEDGISSWELARFTLKKFFGYMMDPKFNEALGDGPDRGRSQVYAQMTRIREQVRQDILQEFDPTSSLSPENRKKVVTRLYDIIGSGGRGKGGDTGVPEGIQRVLDEIRKTPAVAALIERHQKEKDRLTMRTAKIVWNYKFRKMKASLRLLGTLLFKPSSEA